MGDNLKWFKVWTSITDDPDFLEMSLEDIARWVLLGAYIRKHGISGKIIISDNILAHLLRCEKEEINVTIAKLHNVQKNKNNNNDKNIVTFKNWHKYQIDDSSQRVSKFRQNVTMQDKIREDKIKIREDKIKTKVNTSSVEVEKKSSGVKDFLAFCSQQFNQKFSEILLIDYGRDGMIMKKLLSVYGLDKLKELWGQFMQSDDSFIQKTGYSIPIFKTQINKLLTAGKTASKPTTSAGIAMEYLRKKAMAEQRSREEGSKNAEAGHGEVIDISVNSISESKDLAKRTGF